MPIPTPNSGESESDFMGRCMTAINDMDPNMNHDQMVAICMDKWAARTSSHQPERRVFPVEMRVTDGQEPQIQGYSAMFGRDSQDLGGFVERIAPGAFKKTIKESHDIMALFNHDPNIVLGRSGNGTLRLSEDGTGLKMEVSPPNTAIARDVVEVIRRGDVTGQSFSFQVIKESWDSANSVRTLEEVRLFDVGPVVFPAYKDTIVSARALEIANSGKNHSEEPVVAVPSEPDNTHSEAEAEPEIHSVTVRPLANLVKEWTLEKMAGE